MNNDRDHYALERRLDRDEEREPTAFRGQRLPHRPMATRTRLADIMCGALVHDDTVVVDVDEAGPTQRIEPETLAECAAYHREQLAKVGLVDNDAGVLQPPVKLAGAV